MSAATTSAVDLIRGITWTPSSVPNPPHEVVDQAKFTALATSMAEHGWIGAPVVVDGEDALTGSHRIAATCEVWHEYGIEVPIPRVQIGDLCAAFGIDWDSVVSEMSELYESSISAAAAAAEAAGLLLPADVVDYLGYDVCGP